MATSKKKSDDIFYLWDTCSERTQRRILRQFRNTYKGFYTKDNLLKFIAKKMEAKISA